MSKTSGWGGFITFRTSIGRTLMIIVYLLGAAGITVAGISYLLPRTQRIPYLDEIRSGASGTQILIGLGVLIVGNLVWRVLCEAGAVLFSIREDLQGLRALLEERRDKPAGPA